MGHEVAMGAIEGEGDTEGDAEGDAEGDVAHLHERLAATQHYRHGPRGGSDGSHGPRCWVELGGPEHHSPDEHQLVRGERARLVEQAHVDLAGVRDAERLRAEHLRITKTKGELRLGGKLQREGVQVIRAVGKLCVVPAWALPVPVSDTIMGLCKA
jgi:hypothetical protein